MNAERPVRTRIAPSPTGDPHIGTAYMLVFNHVFARKHGGQVILRIEDTDQQRSTPESERAIVESLGWLGLALDEGPHIGGPHGPYRQSERSHIYREYAERLLHEGHAYACFCTPDDLAARREKQQGGPDPCAELAKADAQARIEAGESHTVRMRTPDGGECTIPDMLRGEIQIPWKDVDDQVLLKSDGLPTYHLANVVDDHLMEITHVLRGEEWISSAPKHLMLYQYFGWEPPALCHLPLLRNPDKSKLSKRKNPVSIQYYRDAGFLPEALVNYLCLMAYTRADGEEVFSIDEMIETFDPKRISLGGPVFDVEKLKWLNGVYLRERMSVDQIVERLRAWRLNDETWRRILPLAQQRIETLGDLVPMTSFFFTDQVDYDAEALMPKKLDGAATARLMQIVVWQLDALRHWGRDAIHQTIANVAETEGLKLRDVVQPLFVALTGSPTSTPLFDSMAVLGPDLTRRRMRRALDVLSEAGHKISNKQRKALEKEYAANYTPAD